MGLRALQTSGDSTLRSGFPSEVSLWSAVLGVPELPVLPCLGWGQRTISFEVPVTAALLSVYVTHGILRSSGTGSAA